jgi:hypothetical protein
MKNALLAISGRMNNVLLNKVCPGFKRQVKRLCF